MEGVAISLADAGGWAAFVALATLVVVSLLRGHIVPKGIADMWLKAWEVEKSAREVADRQAEESLELSRTAVALLRSLTEADP